MGRYTSSVKNGTFAVHVECDDFLEIVRDESELKALQALLDKHMVLHVSPQKEMDHETVGRLAVFLGMPANAAPRQPSAAVGDGAAAPPPRRPMSADYPFIGDFSSARARSRAGRARAELYREPAL